MQEDVALEGAGREIGAQGKDQVIFRPARGFPIGFRNGDDFAGDPGNFGVCGALGEGLQLAEGNWLILQLPEANGARFRGALLDLAQNSRGIFRNRDEAARTELLRFVMPDSIIEGDTVKPVFRAPFDIIRRLAEDARAIAATIPAESLAASHARRAASDAKKSGANL